MIAKQPLRHALVPNESDSSLVGAWLNVKARSGQDFSIYGNNGVVSGDLTLGSGIGVFGGTNGVITIADANQYDVGTGAFTAAAWVKTSTTGKVIVSHGDAQSGAVGNQGFALRTNSWDMGYSSAGGVTGDQQSFTGSILDNAWHRVVLVRESTVLVKLYIDGALDSQKAIPAAVSVTSSQPFGIGDCFRLGSPVGNYLVGSALDVQFHNAAWSITDVQADFAKGVPDDSLKLAVDGSGTDRSRYGLSFTPQTGTKIGGRRIVLNGSTAYLLNSTANWRSSDTAGTIMAWVKRAAAGAYHVVFASADEAGTNAYFVIQFTSSNFLEIRAQNAGVDSYQLTSSATFAANQWHHIAVTTDGSTVRAYANGNATSLTAGSGANNGDWLDAVSGRDNVTIGALKRSSVANYFNGSLDDVRYCNEEKGAAWLRAYVLATRGRY